jgi:hypothetical protein
MEAMSDLAHLQSEREAALVRRLDDRRREATMREVAALRESRRELTRLSAGATQGAALMHAATDRERAVARAEETSSALAEVADLVEQTRQGLGSIQIEGRDVGAALIALDQHLAGRIAQLQGTHNARLQARERLAEFRRRRQQYEEIHAGKQRAEQQVLDALTALRTLDQRREVIWRGVVRDAEDARTRIVARCSTKRSTASGEISSSVSPQKSDSCRSSGYPTLGGTDSSRS